MYDGVEGTTKTLHYTCCMEQIVNIFILIKQEQATQDMRGSNMNEFDAFGFRLDLSKSKLK